MENSTSNEVIEKKPGTQGSVPKKRGRKPSGKSKSASIKMDIETRDILKEVQTSIESRKENFKVSIDVIIRYAIEKLNSSDHQKIFESNLSDDDIVDLEYEKYVKKQNGENVLSQKRWLLKKAKLIQ